MSAVLPSPVGATTIVPRRAMLLGIRGWAGVTIALAVVAVIVPVANLAPITASNSDNLWRASKR